MLACLFLPLKFSKFLLTFACLLSQVLSASLNGSLKCSCNHLTSFGGSLLVKPNPIDFDRVLVEFKTLDETGNVAVIATVTVAFMIYFLVVFIARRADKRDAGRVSLQEFVGLEFDIIYVFDTHIHSEI